MGKYLKNSRKIWLPLFMGGSFILFPLLLEIVIALITSSDPAHLTLPWHRRLLGYITFDESFTPESFMLKNLLFLLCCGAVGVLLGIRLNTMLELTGQLKVSERRLNNAFNVVKEGVFEWTAATRRIYMSESFFRMCGYDSPTRQITAEEHHTYIHPDDRDYEHDRISEALAECAPINFQIRLLHKEGYAFPVHVRGQVYCDGAPEQLRIVGTIRDLSSDLEAKRNIALLNGHLDSTLRQNQECLFEISMEEFRMERCISAPVQLAGFPVRELAGEPLNSILSDVELGNLRAWAQSQDVYNEEKLFRIDAILQRAHLSVPVRLSFRRSRLDGRELLIMNMRDLTAEYDANINAMLLKMAADSSMNALVITQENGAIYYLNKMGEAVSPKMKLHENIWSIIPDLAETRYRNLWAQSRTNGESDLQMIVDDHLYEIKSFYLAVRPGFLCLRFQDRTEEQRHEQQLTRALEAEKSANQKRLQVLNAINYELRKPLTGIMGFADLLQDENLTSLERHEYLDMIIESGNNLLNLWTAVLELTNLECGLMEVAHERLNINSLLTNLHNIYAQRLTPGVEMRLNKTMRDVDANIISDESILLRIFEKLLDNAVKFTRKGWIEIGYRAGDGELTFYVEDSGVGIAPELLLEIFEPFRSEGMNLDSARNANGLGMAIAKQLATLLHGTITATSERGKGSKFCISLPVRTITGDMDE